MGSQRFDLSFLVVLMLTGWIQKWQDISFLRFLMVNLLKNSYTKLRNVHLQFKPAVPLSTIQLSPPNLECSICHDSDQYAILLCDTSQVVPRWCRTRYSRGEVSVYGDKRVLSDPDWEDNFDRTLESVKFFLHQGCQRRRRLVNHSSFAFILFLKNGFHFLLGQIIL